MIYATLIVLRDHEPVEVEVSGQLKYYGSYNPHERGEKLGSWHVESPKGFTLTPEECRIVEELLEGEI